MIVFIRHGETELNRKKLLQGRSDVPLNDAGRRQAEQVRDALRERGFRFDRVYTSPLSRAKETARIVAGDGQELMEDTRLLEMDYGPYEGSSLDPPAPELLRFFSDFAHNPAPDGMESLEAVKARLADFLAELHVGADETVLISTHAIAMKGALEVLTPEADGAYWSRYLKNCAVYTCRQTENGFTVPQELTLV